MGPACYFRARCSEQSLKSRLGPELNHRNSLSLTAKLRQAPGACRARMVPPRRGMRARVPATQSAQLTVSPSIQALMMVFWLKATETQPPPPRPMRSMRAVALGQGSLPAQRLIGKEDEVGVDRQVAVGDARTLGTEARIIELARRGWAAGAGGGADGDGPDATGLIEPDHAGRIGIEGLNRGRYCGEDARRPPVLGMAARRFRSFGSA